MAEFDLAVRTNDSRYVAALSFSDSKPPLGLVTNRRRGANGVISSTTQGKALSYLGARSSNGSAGALGPAGRGFGGVPRGPFERPVGAPREGNGSQLRIDAQLLEYRLDL
jgi:hypothetical protein